VQRRLKVALNPKTAGNVSAKRSTIGWFLLRRLLVPA